MKSPPELWELVDQPERLQGWMSSLVGHATEIEVTAREPNERLEWKAAGADATIELELCESGWGTKVSLSAQSGSTELNGWADAVLDELTATERRPFKGVM